MAVTLPLMFRFGVEKGRLAMLLLIGLICGGAAGVAGMETFAVGSVQNLPVLLLAAALAIAVNAVLPPHRRPLLRRPGETVTVNIFAKTIIILMGCPGFLRKAGAFSLRREGRSW